jgi:hypothetical protein
MGAWGIAGLLAILTISTETGRNYLRRLVKTGVRAGYQAKESVGELASKAKSYGSDLVDEVKAESAEVSNGQNKKNRKSLASSDED